MKTRRPDQLQVPALFRWAMLLLPLCWVGIAEAAQVPEAVARTAAEHYLAAEPRFTGLRGEELQLVATKVENGPAMYRIYNALAMLAADGVTIESYPDPSDLRGASGPPLPTDVGNGFLLDNRGIGPRVAFLDMDHGTYAAMEKAPTMEEIKALITDKDPIASMYNCGPRSRYSDITGEITQIIVEGALDARCKKLR